MGLLDRRSPDNGKPLHVTMDISRLETIKENVPTNHRYIKFSSTIRIKIEYDDFYQETYMGFITDMLSIPSIKIEDIGLSPDGTIMHIGNNILKHQSLYISAG